MVTNPELGGAGLSGLARHMPESGAGDLSRSHPYHHERIFFMTSFIDGTFDPTDGIDLQIDVLCAAHLAAYKRALDDVIDLDPQRLAMVHGNPLTDLDEEVIALVNAAAYAEFREGVRSVFTWAGGAASTPRERLCDRCHGHGRLRAARQAAVECPECEGDGIVGVAA